MKQSHQLILAALIRGQSFGLEIAERVKSSSNGRHELGQATLYPALRELEAGGLLHSWEEQAPGIRGGRPRRYYSLTALGSAAAMEEREAALGLWGLLLPGGAR
ncbi:MAG: hypothetical protein JWM10_3146 [Myxococcaceae bacterium]|nr:hypothetical protein [Myxococcaceae bacterium]